MYVRCREFTTLLYYIYKMWTTKLNSIIDKIETVEQNSITL